MSSFAPSQMRISFVQSNRARLAVLAFVLHLCAPLEAQEHESNNSVGPADGREVIDILARPRAGPIDPRLAEQCEREAEAATISGEIVVCREIVQDPDRYRTGDENSTQDRYARETMYANDPQAPDVAGPGIFRGPATVGRMCIPGLQKCPPPPALMIDLTALPEAPPGSDADRIARGLPPLGREDGETLQASAPQPELPGEGEQLERRQAADTDASQAESAEPEAGP